MNVLLEYYGAVDFWRRPLEYLSDVLDFEDEDRPRLSDITVNDAVSYIRRYAYVNFSYKRLYPGKPLLLTQLYLALSIMRIESLSRLFPVEYRVRPRNYTARRHYEDERWFYRIAHDVAKQGDDLKKNKYDEYKCIAQKYNWPFIVNSNDTEY